MFLNYEKDGTDKRWVVGYARVSTKEQLEGYSILNQETTIQNISHMLEEDLHEIYIDEGKSAFKKQVKRPGFDRLINDVKKNQIKAIIVWKSDRLIRDFIKSEYLNQLFLTHKVTLLSATEFIDLSTADGRKEARKKGVDNQYESERTSERTCSALLASARIGNFPKKKIPLGFRRIHNDYPAAPIVEDEIKGPQVRDIFKMVDENHWGVVLLNRHLNSTNYMERNWSENSLYCLLSNSIYIGTYMNNRNKPTLIIKNHTKGFVSKELFDRVQDIIHTRSYEKKYKYFYKGYMYCENCGKKLIAASANNGKSSFPFLYYDCVRCHKRINQKKLEALLEDDFNARIADRYNYTVILDLKLKLKRIALMISDIDQNFLDNIISEKYYSDQKKEYLIARKKAENELKKQESGKKIFWNQLDYTSRREWLRKNVCKIHYNFDNKTCIIEYKGKETEEKNEKNEK